MTQIWGRGLFCSETDPRGHRRIFTKDSFDALCKQTRAWGISFLHIKVADGPNIWYTMEEMQTLAQVAQANNIRCYPYHFCYGDGAGSSVTLEARISSLVGMIFGGVCPQMQEEWERVNQSGKQVSALWAAEYGKQVRQSFRGPLLPMLFADPANHPRFPYLDLFSWSNGWMPMVFSDLWEKANNNAQALLATLDPQWSALEKQFGSRYGYIPPVLPVIELGDPQEAVTWIAQTQHYGYCGFWSDSIYTPFASEILSAPEPSWDAPAQIPAPTTPIPAPPIQTSPIPLISLGMEQGISDEDLAACYSLDGALVPDLSSPLVTLWAKLTQKGYGIGHALGEIETITRQGKEYQVLHCSGGDVWYNAREQRTWVQLFAHTRVPGALPSPIKDQPPEVPVEPVTMPEGEQTPA